MPQITWDQNFIGTIVIPIVALIAAVAIYFLQRQRKRLAYELLSVDHVPPFEAGGVSKDYDVRIAYTNSGNQPLVREDFRSAISTEFIGADTIVAAESSPPPMGIYESVSVAGCVATLKPDLMNPGDAIYATFRVRGLQNKVNVAARVAGVSHVENSKLRRFIADRAIVLSMFPAGYYLALFRNGETLPAAALLKFAIPLILLFTAQIVGVLRTQCLLYFSHDVCSR